MAPRLGRLGRRFARDRGGLAAVEFALILPILAALYVGTIEITQAVVANRKLVATASSLGDLAAQAQTISDTEMGNIFNAATSTMYPFATGSLTMRVSQIRVLNNQATVRWSDSRNMAALVRNTPMTGIPSGLTPGDPTQSQYVVLAEVGYAYTSPLGNMLVGALSMTDRFWLRPRIGVCVQRNGTCD
jgi:Flp pilus assembly protein TadG